MTTVINNPSGGDGGGGTGTGMIIGILVAIVIIVLFFIYGLPALRNEAPKDDIDINLSLPTGGDNEPSGGTPPPAPY